MTDKELRDYIDNLRHDLEFGIAGMKPNGKPLQPDTIPAPDPVP